MFRSRFLLAATVAAVALLAGPATSQAAFTVYAKQAGVNSGNYTAVLSGPDFVPLSASGTYGSFQFTIYGASSNNAANLSELLTSTTRVQNITGTQAKIELLVVQSNYTLPSGPQLSVSSSMGGSITAGTLTMTPLFQAWADATNTATSTPIGTTAGPQNGVQTGSSYDTGTATTGFTKGPGAFSLYSLTTLELTGGGVANFSNQVNVTTVPAPAGVVLLASALPFAVGLRRRFRKATPATAA